MLLLLHGTGASAHSWRQVAPLAAAAGHQVVVPDLPGHGGTRAVDAKGARHDLPAMADALAALLQALGVERTALRWLVGHSAGAAIGARLVLDGTAAPRALIAFNGALLPLQGPAGVWFSPIARWLALNPLVPAMFAWTAAARPALTRRLLAGTGSRLDDEGMALYERLLGDASHVAGALAMMASWDLAPLAHALPRLPVPLELLVGERDRTLPPAHALRVRERVPSARITRLPGLGHLMHEEDPAGVWARLVALQPGLGVAA